MSATWRSALRWRLERHYLGGERAGTVEDVIGRLTAVPSWTGDAALAVALRLREGGRDTLARAVAESRVLTTYAFRGAVHHLHPASAGAYLAVRAAGRQWELPSWRQHYRLEPEDWPGLRATVRDALSDGPLTRAELAGVVAREPRYAHLAGAFGDPSHTFLKPFAWQGDLCLGPVRPGPGREQQVTLRLPSGIPGWTGLPPLEEAGPAVIREYLGAYGPTTVDRLAYWFVEGLSAGRKRLGAWLRRLEPELAEVDLDGRPALCLAADTAGILGQADTEPPVVLLPGLDPWILGPGTADSRIVPPAHRAEITRGANVILVGGRVAGTWRIADGHVDPRFFAGEPSVPEDRLGAAVQLLRAVT